jgi:hypothetical protein
MSAKSTVGMKIVAIINVLYGGMVAIGNTIEVIRGETFDGKIVDSTPMALLGLAGAAFAALLLVGGIGTWLVKPYGRKLSLIAAAFTIVLNGIASVQFGFPVTYFLLGAVYPVILFIVFNLPRWKEMFGAAAPSPVGAS